MLQLADEVYAKLGGKPKPPPRHDRAVVSDGAGGDDRGLTRTDRFDPANGLLAKVLRFRRSTLHHLSLARCALGRELLGGKLFQLARAPIEPATVERVSDCVDDLN